MSSGFQNSGPLNRGLSAANNDATVHVEDRSGSLRNTNAATAAAATEKHNACPPPPQRFKNLKLDELSEELDRRTKETHMLQEEVENATRLALARVGCTYSIDSTPQQKCHTPILNLDGSPGDPDIPSTHHQPVIQPLMYGLDALHMEVAQRGIDFPGKEVLENAIEHYCQQVSELQKQLDESHDHHQQQKFHFRQTIIKLQTSLQEVQMERDVLSDHRMKDSRKYADQMEKMQEMLRELQSTKRSGDQKLQETEDEVKSLSMKAESMERTIKEVYSTLMAHEKPHGGDTGHDTAGSPRQLPLGVLAAKVLEDLEHEKDKLQESLSLAVEQLRIEEKRQGKAELMLREQKDRTERLIASHDQEVARLTDTLTSSRNNSANLSVKLELLQKHAQSQAELRQCELTELETALSIHKDKVCSLEQEVTQTRVQAEEAQRGRDRALQHAEELEANLGQITSELCRTREELAQEKERQRQCSAGLAATAEELRRELEERTLVARQLDSLLGTVKEDRQAQTEAVRCNEQQRRDLQEEVRALRGQLEEAGERFRRGGEEEGRLRAQLEQRVQEGKEALEEKDKELKLSQQEAQRGRAMLEEARGQCQARQAEVDVLRLKLDDREKAVEVLKLQMESSARITVRHGRAVDDLHQDKSHLSDQLHQLQLEVQSLRAELGERDSGLAALEQDRQRLQASLTSRGQRLREASLEKQQLSDQLETQRAQVLSLTEERMELKRLHSSKSEEYEGVVMKMRAQLNNARVELDRVRSTLRTLEGADGHGLQVAMGMQEQITARREQIDALQGRIQQLEETVDKLHQERRYRSLESRRQGQELASVKEEKRQLGVELEALRSKETRHRDRVSELEAALHKMSESFADCQDFIQQQEQEFVRLKLQHALDLKELRGQNLRAAVSATPSALVSAVPSCLTAPRSSQQAAETLSEQEVAALEPGALVKELRGVISGNPRPHAAATGGTSFLRRRSAPERAYGTTLADEAKEVTGGSKLTRETCSSEPRLLRTADLNENNIRSTFSYENRVASRPPSYASSPQSFSLGRRSPVYSLLTSDPNTNRPSAAISLTNNPTLSSGEAEETELARQDLNEKLDNLQTIVEDLKLKNLEISSFIKGQEGKTKKLDDKGRLYKTPN